MGIHHELNIKDHLECFRNDEFAQMIKNKRENFENWVGEDKVKEVAEWTKSWEYRELNFKREAISINPAKACQPLGALFCALGFEKTLPFSHGSQGCVAYFRTHMARHFKEPVPMVSTSMTEDAAVFGGLSNMNEGLQNAIALYRPKMIAVSTTCMAEVIGDDLNGFIRVTKEKGLIPEDFPVPFAHTPSFVGSHITGYDNQLKGILEYMTNYFDKYGVDNIDKYDSESGEFYQNGGLLAWLEEKKGGTAMSTLNLILGFHTYLEDFRETKRIIKEFGEECIILSDPSDNLDSGLTGEYKLYYGGTPIKDIYRAKFSLATISFQKYSTQKTREYIENAWKQPAYIVRPYGVQGTDEFLQLISKLTGKPVPESLSVERQKLLDAMADSYYWIHGKRFALWGDPDFVYGITSFLLELGAEPVHILCTNAGEEWANEIKELCAKYDNGKYAQVFPGKDLWHMRSLLFTEPVDYMIGTSYGKFLWRDTKTPLIRIGYPIFDRHHLHRYGILFYKGAINLLTWIVNTILDETDRNTIEIAKTDYSFDLIR